LGQVGGLDEIRQIVAQSFPTRRYEPENPSWWDAAYRQFEKLTD